MDKLLTFLAISIIALILVLFFFGCTVTNPAISEDPLIENFEKIKGTLINVESDLEIANGLSDNPQVKPILKKASGKLRGVIKKDFPVIKKQTKEMIKENEELGDEEKAKRQKAIDDILIYIMWFGGGLSVVSFLGSAIAGYLKNNEYVKICIHGIGAGLLTFLCGMFLLKYQDAVIWIGGIAIGWILIQFVIGFKQLKEYQPKDIKEKLKNLNKGK